MSTQMFELIPTNGRKSFYGKAKVIKTDDHIATLYSYDTVIATYNILSNEFSMIYNQKLSNTTSSHLKSFKQHYGI